MALGNPIQLRLSTEKQLLYESEASTRNMPLVTYLRERLESGDNLLEEISALRRTVAKAIETITSAKSSDASLATFTELSIQVETLLLLRSIANPQKLQIIHSELKRLGLDVWNGNRQEGD